MTTNVQSAYYTVSRTVAAGKVDIIDIGGSYVACLASNLLSFLISLEGGPSQFIAQGIKIKSPIGSAFKNLIVDNSGNGASLTYTLAIGLGDVTDARTPVPTQEPLDVSALAGNEFMGAGGAPATAAQFYSVYLQNAASNTITGLLRSLQITSTLADTITFGFGAPIAAGAAGVNKLATGAAAKFTMPATVSGVQNSGLTTAIGKWAVQANVIFTPPPFRGPLVIPPNKAFILCSGVVNVGNVTNYEWREQ